MCVLHTYMIIIRTYTYTLRVDAYKSAYSKFWGKHLKTGLYIVFISLARGFQTSTNTKKKRWRDERTRSCKNIRDKAEYNRLIGRTVN